MLIPCCNQSNGGFGKSPSHMVRWFPYKQNFYIDISFVDFPASHIHRTFHFQRFSMENQPVVDFFFICSHSNPPFTDDFPWFPPYFPTQNPPFIGDFPWVSPFQLWIFPSPASRCRVRLSLADVKGARKAAQDDVGTSAQEAPQL